MADKDIKSYAVYDEKGQCVWSGGACSQAEAVRIAVDTQRREWESKIAAWTENFYARKMA